MATLDDHPAALLHREVDSLCDRLSAHHRDRLRCARGCSGCCVDGIRVFAVEADLIRRAHPEVLEQAPHAVGACAFLDGEGGCRIYAERPYVCRTQGLPLRWLDESEEGELVERRDICELNEAGTPLVQLRAGECWTIGPAEEKLRNLQQAFGGGFERVSLRQLFRKPPPNA